MAGFHMNMPSLMRKINANKKLISDKNIKRVLKEETIRAYNVIAENTPQYSGYLVSNLRVQVDGRGGGHANDLKDAHDNWNKLAGDYGAVKRKGDQHAIDIASSYNGWFNTFDTNPSWSMDQTITIKYLSDYWRTAEVGVNLRDVNKPGKAIAKGRAVIRNKRSGWQFTMEFGEQI